MHSVRQALTENPVPSLADVAKRLRVSKALLSAHTFVISVLRSASDIGWIQEL